MTHKSNKILKELATAGEVGATSATSSGWAATWGGTPGTARSSLPTQRTGATTRRRSGMRARRWFDSGNNQRYFYFSQGAQITKASHFDYEYVLGHKIVFLCVAKGKPRPTIVWYKDGRELFGHRYLHVRSIWPDCTSIVWIRYYFRSVNTGAGSIGSRARWRLTLRLKVTPGFTSVTLTTSESIHSVNTCLWVYWSTWIVHIAYYSKSLPICMKPCCKIKTWTSTLLILQIFCALALYYIPLYTINALYTMQCQCNVRVCSCPPF